MCFDCFDFCLKICIHKHVVSFCDTRITKIAITVCRTHTVPGKGYYLQPNYISTAVTCHSDRCCCVGRNIKLTEGH